VSKIAGEPTVNVRKINPTGGRKVLAAQSNSQANQENQENLPVESTIDSSGLKPVQKISSTSKEQETQDIEYL